MIKIQNYLKTELLKVLTNLNLELDKLIFEEPKNFKYGDICTNIALQLASKYKKDPKKLSIQIAIELEKLDYIKSAVAEKNGFINIKYSEKIFEEYYKKVLNLGKTIGKQPTNNKWKYIEIVSANPTGYLHIGHARNGIFSDTLVNLFEYAGYSVYKEYLVNDLGNQIDELVNSVWTKYAYKIYAPKILTISKPSLYNGPDIDECVEYFLQRKEGEWIEGVVDILKSPIFNKVKKDCLDYFLNSIEKDLKKYEIDKHHWIKESSFVNNDSINELLKLLKNYITYKDQAIWFETNKFVPSLKPEVLIKNNGKHTYYMQDLIYHYKKLNLIGTGESSEIINVLGADHIGHIDRIKAFLLAIGCPENKVTFITLQMVKLIENNETKKMSKRNSTVIYMKDLEKYMTYEEVRWFFVSQQPDTPLEIDIEKLKLKDYNNPVFYVLYAYSRASKILMKVEENIVSQNCEFKNITDKDRELLVPLLHLEDVIISSAETLSPHRLNQYLIKLAKIFHSYYEDTPILTIKDPEIKREKLCLLYMFKNTLYSCLSILKITAKNEI